MSIKKNFFAPLTSGLGATRRAAMLLLVMLLTTMTAWATTTSTITVGGTDYTLFTGFTATDGTNASAAAYNYPNLVDGNLDGSSSWHLYNDTQPYYIEFNTDDPIIPKGYIFNTYQAGNFYPQAWVLKAKANATDGWTTLSTYSGQTLSSGQEFQYACSNDGNTLYKYFRFEASNSGNNIWLTEIRLYGSVPDVYYTHLTVKAATCTETGIKQDCYQRNDGKYFTDETGTTELAESDVIAPIIPHTGVHHEATDVNIEYWQCSMCSKYFSNVDCTTEITEEETKIYRTITIDNSISGLVTSNVNQALAGATVTLTVSHLIDASTLKVNNGAVELTDNGSNRYTFTVPADNVTVTAETLSTYSFSLPDNMEIVSATNEADGNGKYISGTVITFAPSLRYSASNVSDGTNTLEPDANGVYTVTIENANINITATVVGSSTLYLAGATSDFTAADGETLVGSTSHTVTIANGANITLNNVTITGGIVCEGTATITLVGTNSVNVSVYNKAGIQIGSSGTTLTIKGDGSLTATGGSAAAGIGLGRTWDASVTAGAIVIEGGTVNASGGNGIGTGTVGNDKTASIDGISIKGGTVCASLGKGIINYGSTATIGYIKIYDTIDMVDASKITETVTYMHGETDVTASKTDYFTIGEDGDRRIIVPKDNTDYTITIADGIEHGTLTASATAKYMETVTVSATPALGYRFVRLVVKDADNNDVASTNNTFLMPKSNVTVSAVFEQGTHGTTEFKLMYSTGPHQEHYESIYDGVTTVNLQQIGQSYNILKYEGNTDYRFRLDNDINDAEIPYAGGTGEFYGTLNATNFDIPGNGQTGYYDVTLTDVGNGKWGVSILPTAAQMDVVPDQTYTGSAITPEPLVIAGSLSLTKGTDYVYSYTNNTNVGTATVRATFQGDYEWLGYVEKTFNIVYPTVTTSYVDADGTLHENVLAIPLDNTMTTLAAGTYVVNSDVAYTGSVSFNGPATLILGDGATMSVNQTVNGGNALFVYADAPLTIYGQAEGTGTLTATAADMPGIFTQSNITISGGTIYASSYGIGGIGSVTIADGIVYTDGTGATYDGTLTSDEITAIANKTFAKGMNWTDLKTAMTAGGTRTVTLTNNVARVNSDCINASGTVTLDLNGYTIDGGTSQTNPLFRVGNGVSMTITDSRTGGNLCNSGTNPTVSVEGGTLTLAAGTINAQSNGVFIWEGNFNMTGGTITGGSSSGVDLHGDNARFTMTGGTITGNAVGVDVNSTTATFTVSGNVNITGNTKNSITTDVSLYYDGTSFNPIRIGGALDEAARIGINIDDYAANAITGSVVMVFTDGLKGYGSKQNFVLNGRDGHKLVIVGTGEVGIVVNTWIYDMTLADNADNSTEIANHKDETVNVTLADRTLYKDGKWNTLCLPFALSAEQIAAHADFSGATLMELDKDGKNGFDATDGTLWLTFKTATAIAAGVPYLVKWDAAGTDFTSPVFSGVTIDATASTTVSDADGDLQEVQMVGSYSPVPVVADDKSILFLGEANTLYYSSIDRDIRSCRAYFSVPYIKGNAEAAKARAFVLNFDGEEATGILEVSADFDEKKDDVWYSLDGVRLNGKPTQRGLYINNGKKTLIK